jgi:hypothetical protein
MPGLVTSINGAYTNARLNGDTPALVGGLKGDRLPFTPPYSISANVDYSWTIGGGAKAYLGGSLRFLSQQSGDFDADFRTAHGRQREVPSYTVVDLHAGADFGRFELEVFARNLTNADGKTSTGSVLVNGLPNAINGAIETGVIRPRTIGVTLGASF